MRFRLRLWRWGRSRWRLMLLLKERWIVARLDRASRCRYAAFLARIVRQKRPKLGLVAACLCVAALADADPRRDCDSSFLSVDPDNGVSPRIEILTRTSAQSAAELTSHLFASRARCRETLAVLTGTLSRVDTRTTVRIREFNCEPLTYGGDR